MSTIMICKSCGSTNVTCDGLLKWDGYSWEACAELDNTDCNCCGGEATLLECKSIDDPDFDDCLQIEKQTEGCWSVELIDGTFQCFDKPPKDGSWDVSLRAQWLVTETDSTDPGSGPGGGQS